jgi:GTP-binding protein
MAPKRGTQKRLGKKHRQASTRPKMGKSAPRATSVTGAVSPKKRKELAAKKAAAIKLAKTPTRSPERERKVTLRPATDSRGHGADRADFDEQPRHRSLRSDSPRAAGRPKSSVAGMAGSAHEERDWKEAERLASALTLATDVGHREPYRMPLVAICGRPNVGKSTLFNRLTETRRSIVGDEPGITRDRIYGDVEWAGRDVRLVDTGGVVPDDEELIPAEIFRQAKVGLEEADAIIMVVDGRTELASPDVELARLLLRGGKPVFLAVNKMDAADMFAASISSPVSAS